MSEDAVHRGDHRLQEIIDRQSRLALGDDRRGVPTTSGQPSSAVDGQRPQAPQPNSWTQATASRLKYWQEYGNPSEFMLTDRRGDFERTSPCVTHRHLLYETSFDDVFDRQRVTAV